MAKFFNSPHPAAEMGLGAVFVIMGVVVGPMVAVPEDRVNQGPLNMIPTPVLVGVLVVCGVVVFAQGLGTWIRRKRLR
ncbi:hypothetical protein DEI96_000595 [Curtobacterium sp. MCLR17_031]|uniref:hypothetical protein n=1 Tax=Curtobacterium sp. MCLR17_031 TaxID=2175622 RepID=UPI000DA74882|nr:hypothetical protein [Curtobacterium sp. MCLR17_031]WIE58143.1 hypothetical protein DEI96_000595 [Curtobacterium sp. MCLR17_031]